ncbi:CDPK-related protein kinase [Hordeum vulgare]|nr:CDPK-related protein kinase [Hordeum vulgare]
MWSSRRGSGSRSDGESDPERERHVRSDGARKRVARRWTNCGISPPASFRSGRRGSTTVGRSPRASPRPRAPPLSAPLLPVKRQRSEESEDVVTVKEEPEELGRRGVVGPEDFVTDVEVVAAAIAECRLHEEAERRCHDEEILDL